MVSNIVAMDDDDHPSVVEMDCVEGSRNGNGKALLTLLFRCCMLQLAFILENHDSANVTRAINVLETTYFNQKGVRTFSWTKL